LVCSYFTLVFLHFSSTCYEYDYYGINHGLKISTIYGYMTPAPRLRVEKQCLALDIITSHSSHEATSVDPRVQIAPSVS